MLTRPAADSTLLARHLADRGHRCLIDALLDIRNQPGPALNLDGVQGLLVTSANGIRAFALRNAVRDLPVKAVGAASAEAARLLGFNDVASAEGDVESLAGLVAGTCDPAAGRWLHPAGSKLAGDLGGRLERAGFGYEKATLYEAVTADALKPETRQALNDGNLDGVLLYSPRTARTFAELVVKAGLDAAARNLSAFCLSAAVAERLTPLGLSRCRIARRPDEAALFDLLDPA
ncbi:MAG: uroporphyrinogen-III synthase [Rhodospirillales bacterium]